MVSREQAEAIRASYDGFNQRDCDAWLSALHDEIEVHELRSGDTAIYRGHREVWEWTKGVWANAAEGFRLEPEHFTEAGPQVVVSVQAFLSARGSGVALKGRLNHVVEVGDGKVRRIWGYLREAEALLALELAEK